VAVGKKAITTMFHAQFLGHRCGDLLLSLALASISMAVPQAAQNAAPQRIVSVIPAITEMLFAIGAGPQVVGVGSFDRFLPEIAKLPRVGALLDPDMEQIFSLRPDLVALYGSHLDQQSQLARADIPVFSYRHGGLDDVTATIRELGHRTGHAAEAEQVARSIEQGLEEIRKRVAGRKRPRTLVVIGREPGVIRNVYANGGVGFLHDMLEVAGATNVFGRVEREAVQPASEIILTTGADVIIELRVEGILGPLAIEREIAAWNRLSTLPAVRTGRVHFLIGSDLVIPGPRIVEGTRRLAQLIHPEAF